jgi:hypothetical protein
MSEVGVPPAAPSRPLLHESAASAAKIRSGGLLLAVACGGSVLATLLSFLLPAARPGAIVAERAALVARSSGLLRLISSLGVVSAMALALSAALLISRTGGKFGAWGRLAWRLMIVTAVLFLSVDLFNLFAIVPLARDVAAGRGLFEFFEAVEIKAIGAATLVFSCTTFMVFIAETSARHRAIGSGWIAFGLICAAVGVAGGIGMLWNVPRLALLFIVPQLCYIPLLRLGIRVAAGEAATSRA